MKFFRFKPLMALFFLLLPRLLWAGEIPGAVSHEGVIISVASAGELTLWEKGILYPFTLYGIDLPAPDTPQGQAAKKTVSDLIFNTLLKAHLILGKDEKALGIVMIGETCLNQTLIRSGIARVSNTCAIQEICGQWKKDAADNKKGSSPVQ